MYTPAYICDAVRTPFGRRGGILSGIRADDLAAMPLIALAVRNSQVDWEQLDDVLYGCAHASAENIGNIAHFAASLAGLPPTVSGVTINRQCGSGLDAVGSAARAIKSGEASLMIAGGIESMSRIKHRAGGAAGNEAANSLSDSADSFPNGHMYAGCDQYAVISAAKSIERAFAIDRQSETRYVSASIARAYSARKRDYFEAEITPVTAAPAGHEPVIVTEDECLAFSPSEERGVRRSFAGGYSASDADGACALLLACEKTAHKYSLLPRARVLGMAVAGVPQSIIGIGPATAARKVLVQTRLSMEQIDVIELNDWFVAQSLAVLRDWALSDDDPRVNPNGGAIALGNPYGASGARLVATAINQLHRIKGRYALCATCVGAGQGIALVIERV